MDQKQWHPQSQTSSPLFAQKKWTLIHHKNIFKRLYYIHSSVDTNKVLMKFNVQSESKLITLIHISKNRPKPNSKNMKIRLRKPKHAFLRLTQLPKWNKNVKENDKQPKTQKEARIPRENMSWKTYLIWIIESESQAEIIKLWQYFCTSLALGYSREREREGELEVLFREMKKRRERKAWWQ